MDGRDRLMKSMRGLLTGSPFATTSDRRQALSHPMAPLLAAPSWESPSVSEQIAHTPGGISTFYDVEKAVGSSATC
jgi:hypothetical protein